MVERLQEGGDVERHNAAHDGGDTEDDGRQANGEAGVVVRNEGVEDDADAFAAVDDGEGVESNDEEQGSAAGEAGGEDAEEGEEEGGQDFEGEFRGGIGEEKGERGVGAVGMLVIEDLLFVGVDGDVLEHADEVEGGELLDEAQAGLHTIVIVLEGGDEEGEDDGKADDLRRACDDRWRVAAEIDEAAVEQQRVSDPERCHSTSKTAELGWTVDM